MAALYGSGAIGGVINLISRQGREPGPHVERRTLPAAIRARSWAARRFGRQRAGRLRGDLRDAVAARLRSDAEPGIGLQRRAAGIPRHRSARSISAYTPFAGTRFSSFLRARATRVRFQRAWLSDLRQRQLHRARQLAARAHRRDIQAVRRVDETGLFVGGCRTTGNTFEPFNPLDPNLASNDLRYHAYERTCSGTTPCISATIPILHAVGD